MVLIWLPQEMGFDEKGLNKVLANVDNRVDDEFDAEKEVEAITEPIVATWRDLATGRASLDVVGIVRTQVMSLCLRVGRGGYGVYGPAVQCRRESKNYAADVSKIYG